MVLDLLTSLHDFGDTLFVRVTTKASKNKVECQHLANGQKRLCVYVTESPENNKANEAVLQLLAKTLMITKNQLKIVKGHQTRDKIIKLSI